MKIERARSIEERKFVRKWLGATVYCKPIPQHGTDGMFYLVTAVDVVRGKVLIGGEQLNGEWRDVSQFNILKSTKKRHYRRVRKQMQFVQN
jgi:hypothetical protein